MRDSLGCITLFCILCILGCSMLDMCIYVCGHVFMFFYGYDSFIYDIHG